jgi:hypothetical protein
MLTLDMLVRSSRFQALDRIGFIDGSFHRPGTFLIDMFPNNFVLAQFASKFGNAGNYETELSAM